MALLEQGAPIPFTTAALFKVGLAGSSLPALPPVLCSAAEGLCSASRTSHSLPEQQQHSLAEGWESLLACINIAKQQESGHWQFKARQEAWFNPHFPSWPGAGEQQDKALSILLHVMVQIPSLSFRSPPGVRSVLLCPTAPSAALLLPDPQDQLPMIPLPVPHQDPLFLSCSSCLPLARLRSQLRSIFLTLLKLPGAQGTTSTFQTHSYIILPSCHCCSSRL